MRAHCLLHVQQFAAGVQQLIHIDIKPGTGNTALHYEVVRGPVYDRPGTVEAVNSTTIGTKRKIRC